MNKKNLPDPLHPPPEGKRSILTETVEPHHEIDAFHWEGKRVVHKSKHSEYGKPIYGSSREKEEAKRDIRNALQQQIREKEDAKRSNLIHRVKESETAVAYDRSCIEDDWKARSNKASYLKQFRDENKKMIEQRQAEQARTRKVVHEHERELLTQSPINWSHTLK